MCLILTPAACVMLRGRHRPLQRDFLAQFKCKECDLSAFGGQTACLYCGGDILQIAQPDARAPSPVKTVRTEVVTYRCNHCRLRSNKTAVLCVVCGGMVSCGGVMSRNPRRRHSITRRRSSKRKSLYAGPTCLPCTVLSGTLFSVPC